MEYDNYIIADENIKGKIFPLFQLNKGDKVYLIYTSNPNNIRESIYVGEVIDNKIIPIEEEYVSYFDEFINEIIDEGI